VGVREGGVEVILPSLERLTRTRFCRRGADAGDIALAQDGGRADERNERGVVLASDGFSGGLEKRGHLSEVTKGGITFGNKMVGSGSGVASKQTAGSSSTKDRGNVYRACMAFGHAH